MKNIKAIFLLLLIAVLLSNCVEKKENRPLRIAISKAIPEKNYKHYINWLHNVDSTIICIDMYGLGVDSALIVISSCDGFLLTGGEDVNPIYYGKDFDSSRCHKPNYHRDSIDMALIEFAMEEEMPIMGICRGMQILNVYMGGTLYFDIPTDFDTTVNHRYPKFKPSEHEVKLIEGSALAQTIAISSGQVYSNHHQGIEELAPAIKVIALSNDGLPEAIEYIKNDEMPFLLGVQWHPERMDFNNPLSGKTAELFVNEVKKDQN